MGVWEYGSMGVWEWKKTSKIQSDNVHVYI